VITKASTVGIDVSDQDRALDFYTNKLGFEKLMDEPMSPESEVRWIEVAPAGAETHVVLFKPTGQENRIGTFLNVIFQCDDIHATYEELRSRGVEFSQEPTENPWGMWAQFKDQDDNEIGLVQL
jgi:predicted enzyme related to lactoylglutathione lyase